MNVVSNERVTNGQDKTYLHVLLLHVQSY